MFPKISTLKLDETNIETQILENKVLGHDKGGLKFLGSCLLCWRVSGTFCWSRITNFTIK